MLRLFPKPLSASTAVLILGTSLLLASIVVVKGQDTTPPEVFSAYPADRETDVPLTATIYVNFSEPMEPANASWSILPDIALSDSWSTGTTLILSHSTPFSASTRYTVTVNGTDLAGNKLDGNGDGVGGDPFNWSFTTSCGGACIVETTPPHGAVSVPPDEPIIVFFSQPMTITAMNFSVVPDVPPYSTLWSNGDTVLTIMHGTFSPCTIYVVTISGGGLVDGPVPNPWSFTTECCGAPYIDRITPSPNDVPLDAIFSIEFNTCMNVTTVNVTFEPELAVTMHWNVEETVLNLTHEEEFRPCMSYNLKVTGEDRFGDPLIAGPVPNPYNFTTVCTYPKVVTTSPSRGQTDVQLDAPIIITFSESMDNESVEDSFSYIDDRIVLFAKNDGAISWNDNFTTFTFIPNSPYRRQVTYTVRLNSSIAHGLGDNYLDGNGNGAPEGHLIDDYTWQFTTAYVTDTIPPQVDSVDPVNGATDVPQRLSVLVIFSESMNKSSVQAIGAVLVTEGRIAYNFSWPNNRTVSFNLFPEPSNDLSITIVIKRSVADLVGNQMPQDYSWSFTIELWRGDVYGKVVDEVDGLPIANATVTLNGVQVLTDVNGTFLMKRVLQDEYVLNVSKEGYSPSSTVVVVGPNHQNLGIIKLQRLSTAQPDSGQIYLLILVIITAVLLLLLMLILLSRRRQKMQPAKFEDWEGEIAIAEKDDDL